MKARNHYVSALLFILFFIPSISGQTIEWYTFGSGLSSPANDVVAVGDDVYVGGQFSSAGGIQVNHIAKWDGSSWSALGSGTDGDVYAVAAIGSDIYAAGTFSHAGGVPVGYIAKWNGSNWSSVGSGLNELPLCLTVDGNNLYAGGFFTQAGGSPANRIAKWDGSSWSALGDGFNNEVDVVAVSGNVIYAGGIFSASGGNSIQGFAKWDGSNWSEIGGGVSGYVRALVFEGSDIYVGGNYSKAGVGNNLLRWDGTAWHTLGAGVDGIVNTMKMSVNDLYVGGAFTNAGGQLVNRIAKFNLNNSTWSPIGDGVLYGDVNSIFVQGSTGSMLVAGSFYVLGNGIECNHIAGFTDSENPLPVELTSFAANVRNNDVVLNWQTAAEKNNSGFEILRRITSHLPGGEQTRWVNIGFVEGRGSTTQGHDYSFADKNVLTENYQYRLKQIDYDGSFEYSDIVDVSISKPTEFSLRQNYPNPFNPGTKIKYSIPSAAARDHVPVQIIVYDMIGNEIETLLNEEKPAGTYELTWDAANLPSGVYLYQLRAGDFIQTKKMILLK